MSTEKTLIGPDAIVSDASTYGDIQKAQERLLEVALKLRQPEGDELRPGQVPRQRNNVWNGVDRGPAGKAPRGPWTGPKLASE